MCTPPDGAFRGSPEPMTTPDRRVLPSVTAPVKPAAPPPITATSKMIGCCVLWVLGMGPLCNSGRRKSKLCCQYGKLPCMDDDLDAALAAVGPRLRALRQHHETTLADLSAATGISVSTLSRLES